MTQNRIITTTEGLKIGDVLQVSVQLTDKQTHQPYWWKRFCVVTSTLNHRYARLMTLKLHPDPDKDFREVDFGAENQVVEFMDESRWPQGVVAMRMKAIHTGLIGSDKGVDVF